MKFDYDQDATFVQVAESAKFMMGLVDFVTAVEIPKQFGEDFPKVILAYRDQSEGKKLNLRPELREKVDQLTEILADYSRKHDTKDAKDEAKDEAKVFGYDEHQIKEELSPVLGALAELDIPQESLDKAVKFTAVVMETLIDLTGDEETAMEVYDQLDPAFAPIAVLAYRKQAEGYFFAGGELEPEIRKEVDRLTEILAQLSREQDEADDEFCGEDCDCWYELDTHYEDELPPEVKDRINRLVDRLTELLGGEEESQDSHEHIDHYEDYRINSDHWDYAYGEDEESAHQRLQEDILRAARKNGGYVLATREVWAKPVAKTDDGRWVFETEYGLEYLDFEDYEFEPEHDLFEDEESLVDFD